MEAFSEGERREVVVVIVVVVDVTGTEGLDIVITVPAGGKEGDVVRSGEDEKLDRLVGAFS